ncbi:MAG: TonB-dependent receptor, partial [Mesorhizobium sp.]
MWNTSRFETASVAHELTYGGDWVGDDVDTGGSAGGDSFYTPSGKRNVSGAYIQDKLTWEWLEVIGGLRYDNYSLKDDTNETSGDRVSPRITVGVSPFESAGLAGLQFYGTYAEGYRSPSLTETLISGNHPAGFTANVVQTAANKGVLLAFVAMAQTLVVITAGIDLSVGMIFALTNCMASWLVIGTGLETAFGVLAVLGTGLICGAVNGAIVIYGRLQPIVATIATGAVFFGLALLLRPVPGGSVNEDLADFLTGRFFGVVPASLVALLVIVLVVWVPFSRSE